jgi:hypothetical protein
MRKSLKLLAAATLLLPGCILVARDGDWDDDEGPFHGHRSLEQRVAALEDQMALCKANCPMPCCNGEEAEDDEHEEHEGK